MERPLSNPNLPSGNIVLAAVGRKYKDVLCDAFDDLGINILWLPNNNKLDNRVSGHADMMLHHLGDNSIITAADTYDVVTNSLYEAETEGPAWQISISERQLQSEYPNDILLNSLRIGEYLFCNIVHTDVRIIDYCVSNSIKCITIKQGYAKCSVCIVDEKSVITADKGIAEIIRAYGIDVLLISDGYIDLMGYNSGFIGGSSGKIAKNILAFTGVLDEHPDRNEIINFIESKSVRPLFLTPKKCFDIGSIIPLIEYI